MILKSLIAALALLVTPVHAHNPKVVGGGNTRLLYCGDYLGTAFVVGKNTLATARHLTHGNSVCTDAISGQTVTVESEDSAHDFAIVHMNTDDIQPLHYSCKRYKTGKYYHAYGFGHGSWTHTIIQATPDYTDAMVNIDNHPWPGLRIADAITVAGMSGGPIFDKDWNVVGMVNAGSSIDSLSYELADTPLCRRN